MIVGGSEVERLDLTSTIILSICDPAVSGW